MKHEPETLYAVMDGYGQLIGVFTSRSLAHVVALDEEGGYVQHCQIDVDYGDPSLEPTIEEPCEKLASIMDKLETTD